MKKQFLVSQAKEGKMSGIDVDGKVMKFSKSGYSFTVKDKGMANEIDQKIGQKGDKSVIVSEVPNYKAEPGHNYHFRIRICNEPGCFARPLNKYCEEHDESF